MTINLMIHTVPTLNDVKSTKPYRLPIMFANNSLIKIKCFVYTLETFPQHDMKPHNSRFSYELFRQWLYFLLRNFH